MAVMLVGCQKIMKNISDGKNRKVTFLFSLEKHDSTSNARIPNGTTAQKKRRELLKNQIFGHLL